MKVSAAQSSFNLRVRGPLANAQNSDFVSYNSGQTLSGATVKSLAF